MRAWKRSLVWLVVGLLLGCSPKADPKPTFTLLPTLVLPTAGATPIPTPSLPPPSATPRPSPTPTEVPLAAIVNGESIFLVEFERELARAGDAATPKQVLDAMIEMLLLDQVAAAAGVTITDEQLDDIIQADIEAVGGRAAFEARLVSNNLTAEEYREQVRANVVAQRVQMQMPVDIPDTLEHVHARHILVATQAEAEAILAQLREGADFGTLAQTYSLDVSTRDRGGDLGFFPRGLLLAPELEEAVFALAPAQISDVVHSDLLGYHIVQVLEREERPTDEQNLELIRTNQISLWREQLWAGATIERFIEP